MNNPKITEIRAREILDSKARPTVEVDVWTTGGVMGRAASPCGTSVGSHEAFVLRDGGIRYGGLGVRKAVGHVKEIIAPALIGCPVCEQRAIDQRMIDLDGTSDKSCLGANAIYAVSIAAARAAANSRGLSLFRYLGGEKKDYLLPVPMFNMINGKSLSETRSEFQEFHLIPVMAETYSEALRMGVEIFSKLGDTIRKRFGMKALQSGASAGYAAPTDEPDQCLEILLEAAREAGYDGKCRVGLDCAASDFYLQAENRYCFRGGKLEREELIRVLEDLTRKYSLFMIEDPLAEDDFEGFAEITKRLDVLIVGDDLFVTNKARVRRGIELGSANGMILKPNMVGTLTEAIETAEYAKEFGFRLVGSGRAGAGPEDPIPDIAVALDVPLVKFGAPRSGERISKQNSMLRIEEELGHFGHFAGMDLFKRAS